MRTSQDWVEHFSANINIQRINWQLTPSLTEDERMNILSSLQAWQLGETSDGSHLLKVSNTYAIKIRDHYYPAAVEFFIKEEQWVLNHEVRHKMVPFYAFGSVVCFYLFANPQFFGSNYCSHPLTF